MRYFIGKDGGAVVRDKLAFCGDDTKADGLVVAYQAAHPGFSTQEVDQVTFDGTPVVVDPTPLRDSAVAQLQTGTDSASKLTRAILLVILDEINTIRALLPGPPAPRTVNQLKNAIQNKINAGAAD